jgi:hypothetical protein
MAKPGPFECPKTGEDSDPTASACSVGQWGALEHSFQGLAAVVLGDDQQVGML